MRIAFLVPDIHDRPTGGNIYNRRIAAALPERAGVEVVPWAPDDDPQPPVEDAPDTIVVDSLLLRPPDALRALRAAHPEASLILLAHYLHCIDPGEQASAAAATERALLPLVDGAITTSPFAREALVDEGMPAATVEVVPPGLDAPYRAPVTDRNATGPPALLTVANLLPGKGLPAFVETLGRLDDTAWRWTLVGDDALDPAFAGRLRTQIRESPIADRIRLPSPVPPADLRARYDAADVFVLPSQFETCSMAAREAMARGVPVVGYAVGGLPDNFGDADAGLLAPPDRPDALADALRTLLAHPERRRRMGEAARQRSRSFPTWNEAGARFHSALASFRAADG
jgi:glycosyltransferase involved in cell wall biosynthesis